MKAIIARQPAMPAIAIDPIGGTTDNQLALLFGRDVYKHSMTCTFDGGISTDYRFLNGGHKSKDTI